MKTKILFFIAFLFSVFMASGQISQWNQGDITPNFSATAIDGADFQLENLKGKIVLIDFWATWCAPCLEEQPELKKIYSKWKPEVDKGNFEILGFSMDKNKEVWQNAINRFQINWPQVSDMKMWRSPIIKDYKITELPFNVIIDGNRNIIAVNLHGVDLENFIDSLFNTEPKENKRTD